MSLKPICYSILLLSVASSVIADEKSSLPDPLAAGWAGQPVCEKLHEDAKHRVLRCSFPPDSGHEKHYHAPHFGYALSGGTMRLHDDNGTRDAKLETGSSYVSKGTAWHEVINIGETTVSYLIVEPKPLEYK